MNAHQFYPTPPSAGLALADFLARSGATSPGDYALDPCVGAGALPLWLSGLGLVWHGMDIDPLLVREARSRGVRAVERDSLAPGGSMLRAGDWDGDEFAAPSRSPKLTAGQLRNHNRWHAICNPPFGALLRPFAERVAAQSRRAKRVGAVLTRATWWGDGDMRDSLRPSVLLWIRGRLSFTGDGRADSSTHMWAIWLPKYKGRTVVEWISRPQPTEEQTRIHREMCGIEDVQTDLFSERAEGAGAIH